MSTLIMSIASPLGLKRPLDDERAGASTIEQAPSDDSSKTKQAVVIDLDREDSPLSSVASICPKPDTSSPTSGAQAATTGSAPKRRKLNAAEKEVARIEKACKEQERAAEKARKEADKAKKEEERQQKLEEKKQKDEEREEQKRVKDAERAAKEREKQEKEKQKETERRAREDEKKVKEDAKAKKDKSQMRLNAFFVKPASPANSRRGSVCSTEDEEARTPARSPAAQKVAYFLPFDPPSQSTVAPHNRFMKDDGALDHSRKGLEACFDAGLSSHFNTKRSLQDAFQNPVAKKRRYVGPASVKDIMARLQGSETQPIDLTIKSGTTKQSSPLQELRTVPVKFLKYREDVRPPYVGTYSKAPAGLSIAKLSRMPLTRALPMVNYDYDSEAEWEEPEEGEDLDSEGEEEADDEDEEEMEGFLDDEEADGPKRRHLMGDMEPLSTGLHWAPGRWTAGSDMIAFGESTINMKSFRIESLLDQPIASIDPFSTAYWPTSSTTSLTEANLSSATAAMAPPRIPLTNIPGATNLPMNPLPFATISPSGKSPSTSTKATINPSAQGIPHSTATKPTKASATPAKPIPPELLDDFKHAVSGSDMTKIGLVEMLKKRFPQITRGTVQETLERVAVRRGEKQSEKRWILL